MTRSQECEEVGGPWLVGRSGLDGRQMGTGESGGGGSERNGGWTKRWCSTSQGLLIPLDPNLRCWALGVEEGWYSFRELGSP